jgi:hypothetical protein
MGKSTGTNWIGGRAGPTAGNRTPAIETITILTELSNEHISSDTKVTAAIDNAWNSSARTHHFTAL